MLETLVAQLKIDEGVRLKPYLDTVGKWTIGVGRNISDNGIRMSEAEIMLHNDILEVFAQLDKSLPWWRNMSVNRQMVIANLCFNLGITKLLMFKNTLAAMQRGDYEEAAQGMISSKWCSQVGQRCKRLVQQMRQG